MRARMYGGVRGRKTKVGGKPTFVFLLLDLYHFVFEPRFSATVSQKLAILARRYSYH